MWFADLFQHKRIKQEGEQSNAYKNLLVRKERVDKALAARAAARLEFNRLHRGDGS